MPGHRDTLRQNQEICMRNEIRKRVGTVPAKQGHRVACGSLWPNGEFGLGFAPDVEETSLQEEWGWVAPASDSGYRGFRPECEGYLTSSDAPNSHKGKCRKLTTYGARMVRSSCWLMEKRLGREDCLLWTLTVPPLSHPARVALARNWGLLVNRLVQKLTRCLMRAKRPPAVIGVTEIQTARLERYQEGYLHLHLVAPAHSNNGGRFAVDCDDLRSWWKSALERFSGQESIPTPRVQGEVVRKSVEAYMGKYLSKGSGDSLEGFVEDLGEDSLPGQWWFCSSLMRRKVKAELKSGRAAGMLLDAVVQQAFKDGDLSIFEFIRHIDVVTESGQFTAGWYGRLRADIAADLHEMLGSASGWAKLT